MAKELPDFTWQSQYSKPGLFTSEDVLPVPTALLWKEAPLLPPRTHTPVPSPPACPVSWAYPAIPWEWIQTPHPPPISILPAPDSSRNISLLLPGESCLTQGDNDKSRPTGARASVQPMRCGICPWAMSSGRSRLVGLKAAARKSCVPLLTRKTRQNKTWLIHTSRSLEKKALGQVCESSWGNTLHKITDHKTLLVQPANPCFSKLSSHTFPCSQLLWDGEDKEPHSMFSPINQLPFQNGKKDRRGEELSG